MLKVDLYRQNPAPLDIFNLEMDHMLWRSDQSRFLGATSTGGATNGKNELD